MFFDHDRAAVFLMQEGEKISLNPRLDRSSAGAGKTIRRYQVKLSETKGTQ
jgi:hypothetical protein